MLGSVMIGVLFIEIVQRTFGGRLRSAPYSPPSLTTHAQGTFTHLTWWHSTAAAHGARQLATLPWHESLLPSSHERGGWPSPPTPTLGSPRTWFQGGVRAPQFPSLGNAQLPLSRGPPAGGDRLYRKRGLRWEIPRPILHH